MPLHRNDIIEQAFLAAAECGDDASRERVIAEKCGGDVGLIAEVRSLLGGHEAAAGGVLDRRSVAVPASLAFSRTMGRNEAAGGGLPPGTRLAGYTLVKMIGAGGMGVVYIAEQERPKRTVALKLIRAGMLGLGSSGNVLRRFEAEADILARLHHAGIAQIYEAGSGTVELPEPPDGQPGASMHHKAQQPYLAMELVDGPTITDYAEQHRLSTAARLALMAQVCEAVEHAHQRGVIHRDLKPSNILVDTSGAAPQIKVLDFGVARVTDADLRVTTMQTSVGQLIGTLPYMSPEQVAGDPEAIDTRSDVYALGVVLYQMLTGRLPHDFSSRSIPEAARIIRDETPPPPSRLGGTSKITSALRGDIDTIVAKALEKDKERRYPSARELGDDLRRHLAGEPIAAKRDSVGYVLQKKLKRYRALVTLAAAALLVTVGLGIYAGLSAVKSQRLARDLAAQLSDSNIERARLLSKTDQVGIAEGMLWDLFARRPKSKLARWALWDLYMRAPCLSSIPDFQASSFDCAFSPDGTLCAIANRVGGKVELWDSELRTLERTLDVAKERAFAVAFSPDGNILATGGSDGHLKLWNIKTGVCESDREAHNDWLGSVSFSPDGSTLATAGRGGIVKLWSGAMWTESRELSGHTQMVYQSAFSPDSTFLATSSQDRTTRIWNVQTGACVAVLDASRKGHTFDVSAVAFSPDGKTLATGSFDRTIKLWDVPAFTCRATLESIPGYPERILYSRDGSRMYVSGDGIETRNGEDGRLLNTIMYPEGTRRTISLDPNAPRLLATASRGRVSLWETSPELARVELPPAGFPCQIAFSPDATMLATNGRGNTVRLYAVGHWDKPLNELRGHGSLVRSLAFSPDGRRLATGDRDGRVLLWDLKNGERISDIEAHPKLPIVHMSVSPDSTRLLTLGVDRHVRVWKLADLSPVGDIDVQAIDPGRTSAVVAADWSPDGLSIAVASGLRSFGVWDANTLQLRSQTAYPTSQLSLTFSADSRTIVFGLERAILEVDAATGQTRRELIGHAQGVGGVAFAPGGLLVSCARDHTVRLWDWASGLALLSLSTGTQSPADLAVSSDGRYVAVSMSTGTVMAWDLHYYDRHITNNAEWNLNQLEPAISKDNRARILEGLQIGHGTP